MKAKVSEIVMVENYMETLRKIPDGKTCIFNVLHSGVHQGFKMAKSRMKKQGILFEIELIREKDKEFVKATRLGNKK